ncbi:MAG: hypothetical protein KJ623_01670 [Nanoarchaeota archaeon]|nr:hypothetical protein [Nanoarchaeota archaeon]
MNKKIVFLDEVLKNVENNPELVGEGKLIFTDDMPSAYEEACCVALHLDEEKRAYFKCFAGTIYKDIDFSEEMINIRSPEELLEYAGRYFPVDFEKFRESMKI